MIDAIRRHPPNAPALIDASNDHSWSYHDLRTRLDAAAERLQASPDRGRLVFLGFVPDLEGIALYLACLATRTPVVLTERSERSLQRLLDAYQPTDVFFPEGDPAPADRTEEPAPVPGYRRWRPLRPVSWPSHPDLALLLTTSGSTGNPKLVRLSLANLTANASAIAEYLELKPSERAISSLPLHYSYGLSVLHSHLVAGASIVLTTRSFLSREFWQDVDRWSCTSFAGVPYMYETLHRLRFEPAGHPRLRTYTQAGGPLRPELVAHFHERARHAGARFFVMYGQTEATARMSYVPPERLSEKLGSIGVAIPGGHMDLENAEGDDRDEIVYRGPNVMLGYAESSDDLRKGDVQGGVLRTGDLGRRDKDGYFYVTGRLQRFAKLFGKRVSLDDIEREVEGAFPLRVAALDGGDRIVLHVERLGGTVEAGEISARVSAMLVVPPSAVTVVEVDALPRTSAGKKDYRTLGASR